MPMMVCVPCKALFKVKKNGIDAVFMVDGKAYKVYSSDKWKCPTCGIEILAGFGADGFIQGFQLRDDPEGKYNQYLDNSKAKGNVVEFQEVYTTDEIKAKEEFVKMVREEGEGFEGLADGPWGNKNGKD